MLAKPPVAGAYRPARTAFAVRREYALALRQNTTHLTVVLGNFWRAKYGDFSRAPKTGGATILGISAPKVQDESLTFSAKQKAKTASSPQNLPRVRRRRQRPPFKRFTASGPKRRARANK